MEFFDWLTRSIFHPIFWFQPLFYSVHGWLATEMALWMLFRPYEPKFIPCTGVQLPFTPGIFPRGRHKLSVSIANTITEILLTREDIKKQAEKLITEESIYKTLDALSDSIGSELRDIIHIRRIYRYVDSLMPPLLEKLVNDYITGLEQGKNRHFPAFINRLFNEALPHLALNESQAEFLAQAFFTHIMPPANIRIALIDLGTDETARFVEESLRQRIGGLQGLILRFVDVQKAFTQFRQFLIQNPQEADEIIATVTERLELREKLKHLIVKFSPHQLPIETLEEGKAYLVEAGTRLFIRHRGEIVQGICSLSEEATHSITTSLVHLDYSRIAEEWLPGFKRDLARFIDTYLHKELENLLSKALPAISLNTVIVEKIDQFSARQLEETIQRICHRELRWLAFLGAFLGFWLGLLSNVISYWSM